MGKRGPKPKGEFAGKLQYLSTRITPDLRTALEDATRESGRSLSQEIERRLRDSFDPEKTIVQAFGDRRVWALHRAMKAVGVTVASMPIGDRKKHWLDDPLRFDQVARAMTQIVEAFRPRGGRTVGNATEQKLWARVTGDIVRGTLQDIEAAPADDFETLTGRLRSKLGPAMVRRMPHGDPATMAKKFDASIKAAIAVQAKRRKSK